MNEQQIWSGQFIDPEKWIREQEERASQLREKADRATSALAASSTTVSSKDNSVTITVNPGGILQALQLSPQARSLSPAQLTSKIMETYRAACSQAAAETVAIMSELVGADSEAMAFLKTTLPPIDEEAV